MQAPAAGTLLGGRYLLEHALAEGGMGAVWRARHMTLDIPVAVKLMAPLLAASDSARARFEREAKASARLVNPHVVEVHDYGVDEDTPYIVMELLEGEDLAQRLTDSGRMSADDTAPILEQVCRALTTAHDAGVVHRDLKPGNIFLASRGQEEIVKVLDFGIAKLHLDQAASGTMPGTLMGSPSFMSPEQARGAGGVDHTSDLWSLAVVAFQCLTGHLPFVGDGVVELISSICFDEVPLASGFWPALGTDVDHFFQRALSRPREERFRSARDMADAFWHAIGRPVPPRSVGFSTSGIRLVSRTTVRPGLLTDADATVAQRHRTPAAKEGRSPVAGQVLSVGPSEVLAKVRSDRLISPNEVVVDRFVVSGLAGEGGMGVVYRAFDKVTGAEVALKILRTATLDNERFFREAHVLSELKHPGIVKYVAHGVTLDGRLYLAMEWLGGGDLGKRLRAGVLDVYQSLSLTARIAEGLGAAHRNGIVHGDLKPSNVLLAGADVADVKVIDFGIARLVSRAKDTTLRGREVFGTPGYMAPEQARGEVDIDARADVFALGCLLYQCLVGRAPFAAETPFAALGRVLTEPSPRVRDVLANLPPKVDELVQTLLAKVKDERPTDGAHAAELIFGVAESLVATPRLRESITTGERKIMPLLLIVPARIVKSLAQINLRFASDVKSEDATCALDDGALSIASALAPTTGKFGARLEVLPGGALAASWAMVAPLSDVAAQAASCALALREVDPHVALAIATGRRAVAGDVLDRAVAAVVLSPLSAMTNVALDDVTASLLSGKFNVDIQGEVRTLQGKLKGDAEVRMLLGKATPCIGREPELGMLEALFRECADEQTCRAVILKGPAGAGKSRIRQEFVDRIKVATEPPPKVWIGRGDVMSAGSPYVILSQALTSLLGLSGVQKEDERSARLRAHISLRLPGNEGSRVAAFLADLLGIAAAGDTHPELAAAYEDALLLNDQRRRAFEELIRAECQEAPCVLVLEDLHLADLPTVKLLEQALKALSDCPFFVIATARPELSDLFPKIWEDRVPQEIRVGPLSPKASERLVRHALGAQTRFELVNRILARASGHPLHLEEIVRAVFERGEEDLPDTVLAMVETRIFALDPAARRVLRAASILGRTFWESAVSALTPLRPSDVTEWLRELCAREWITRVASSRFAGETEYLIAQDLVQEAAYAMLPEADRTLGHRVVAEWLERSGERDAVVLARHFELGEKPQKAAQFLLQAAEHAERGNDFESAIKHAERAISLLGDGADAPEVSAQKRGRAKAILAEAFLHRGELEAARRDGLLAIEAVSVAHPAHFRACAAAVVASGKLGDMAGVRTVAEHLLEWSSDAARVSVLAAKEPADVELSTLAKGEPKQSHWARGMLFAFAAAASHAVVQLVIGGERGLADALFEQFGLVAAFAGAEPTTIAYLERAGGARAAFAGDLFGSITHLRAAAAAFEDAGDLRTACSTKKTLGWYLGECGALEEAERSLRESMIFAAKMGLSNLLPHAKHDLGSPLLRLGKLAEARQSQEEALAEFQLQGDRRLESGAHAMLSAIATADGRDEDAVKEALVAIECATSAPIRFTALARLAEAHAAFGRHEEALKAADSALGLIEETKASEECFVVCLLAKATSLFALGRDEEAEKTLERATKEVKSRAEQIRDPDLRASFLKRIPENERVLAMASHRGG